MITSDSQSLRSNAPRLVVGQPAGIKSDSGASNASILGTSGTQMVSSSSGFPRPLEPKFRSLLDLERSVDRNQAESLKMIRLGHRQRHRILTAPQDFFYRNFLFPTAGRAFCRQLWTSLCLLIFWTTVAGLVDVFFAHSYTRTEKSLFQDLRNQLSSSTLLRPWTLGGAVLLAAASTWNYLYMVKIPPLLFASRTKKLVEFLRTLVLNGPSVLVCTAIVFLRPSYSGDTFSANHPKLNQISQSNDDSQAPVVEDSPSLEAVVLWEIVLKTVVPAVFILAVLISVNSVHYWLGDFFIGIIKVQPRGPSLLAAQNPVAFVKHLTVKLTSTIDDAIRPILVFPSRNFWQASALLFFLPILFPVTDLLRLWIQYHFLAFALVHLWKLNLLQMRMSLTRSHKLGDLDLTDWISLPAVLAELKKSGWWWSEYFEMQLRAGFLEQLKQEPNFLSGLFYTRIATKDLNQIDIFIKFWLEVIQEFCQHVHTTQFLVEADDEPRSRRMDFLIWATKKLHFLHDYYAEKSPTNFLDQDFLAYPFACVAKPAVRTIEHVRSISLLAIRAKALDTNNILAANYCKILEQLAALSVVLGNGGKKFDGLMDGRLFQQSPNMEPCIRFYIKSYRQLEHLTRLNLSELVSSLAPDMNELRFTEYPELMPYVDNLIRQTKAR